MVPMTTQKPMQIALVDDDPDEQDFFQIALDVLGIDCEFHFFERADDFFSYVNSDDAKLPDIVFVDMSMPQISGREMIEQLREDNKFDNIQAVIYTAHIGEKDKEAMMSLGTFEFFIKPTEFAELTEMLKGMIERRVNRENGIA